jgi:hypothetical protein
MLGFQEWQYSTLLQACNWAEGGNAILCIRQIKAEQSLIRAKEGRLRHFAHRPKRGGFFYLDSL